MSLLDVTDLHKSFASPGGPVAAVRGVSLTIDAGQVIGFLGPNGAGKTTTIKMIAGLIRPDRGSVTVAGHDPHKDRHALRHIGAVLEGNRNLYWRLTPLENVEYFGVLKGMSGREARRKGEALLERFDLAGKRSAPVRLLSRGMQQKVALAVALVHDPKLLLMDEPTLGLDVESAETVKQLIRETLREGRAVLLTTHQLGVAEEIADRIAIVNGGQIILEEDTRALLSRFSGKSYLIELTVDIDAARREQLAALGAQLHPKGISYLGPPEGLYAVLSALAPLPLQRVARDDANLTTIFLKLLREGPRA